MSDVEDSGEMGTKQRLEEVRWDNFVEKMRGPAGQREDAALI